MSLIPMRAEDLVSRLWEMHSHPERYPMSPHERVQRAVERKKPDRVPFDFWAVPEMIKKLQDRLNLQTEEELIQLLGVDCRIVSPNYIGPELEILSDNTYYDRWGTHRRKVKNDFSTYDEYASYPLSDVHRVSEVESYSRWPKQEYWDWSSLPDKIREINKHVRYYIRYDIGGIFETAWGLYGLDRFLMDLAQKLEIPLAIMDCITEKHIEHFRIMMRHTEGLVDMVYTYDDVAIQSGLLMSIPMWRKSILPFHQKLNTEIKKYDVKILYHSCGGVFDLIGQFIDEMHIDVLNPLQPGAAKMDMAVIKQNFGSRIAFHGGIDIQRTMPLGTPEDVENEVRQRCAVLGSDGGYICTTAHYIQADTPLENVLALYATDRMVP